MNGRLPSVSVQPAARNSSSDPISAYHRHLVGSLQSADRAIVGSGLRPDASTTISVRRGTALRSHLECWYSCIERLSPHPLSVSRRTRLCGGDGEASTGCQPVNLPGRTSDGGAAMPADRHRSVRTRGYQDDHIAGPGRRHYCVSLVLM